MPNSFSATLCHFHIIPKKKIGWGLAMTDLLFKTLKQVQGDVRINMQVRTLCRIHFGNFLSFPHYTKKKIGWGLAMTDLLFKTLKQVQGDVLINMQVRTSCRIHFGNSLSFPHYTQKKICLL